MSEFKGTEGEWFVQTGMANMDILCRRFPAGIDTICKIKNQFKHEQTEANALLISKAPELLHEIEESVKDLLCIQASVKESEKIDSRWEGVYDILQKQIDRKKQLIKSATKIR